MPIQKAVCLVAERSGTQRRREVEHEGLRFALPDAGLRSMARALLTRGLHRVGQWRREKIGPICPIGPILRLVLHRLLFVSQRDVHLLKRYPVERAGHLQPFRLLILAQTLARRIVKLADLLARVKPAVLENRLGLVDLFLIGAKDWTTPGPLFRAGLVWSG